MGNRSRTKTWAIVALLAIAIATPASADWTVYASADVGFSIAEATADGQIQTAALPPLDVQGLGGDDIDVSPFLGGAIGLEVPISEITPWVLPRWVDGFALREEVEVVGLRNYKFTTDRPDIQGVSVTASGKVLTEVEMWTVMVNTWLDIPLDGLYRPISWTSARLFGRWRLSALKQILAKT
jgi:hypothetical protein